MADRSIKAPIEPDQPTEAADSATGQDHAMDMLAERMNVRQAQQEGQTAPRGLRRLLTPRGFAPNEP